MNFSIVDDPEVREFLAWLTTLDEGMQRMHVAVLRMYSELHGDPGAQGIAIDARSKGWSIFEVYLKLYERKRMRTN